MSSSILSSSSLSFLVALGSPEKWYLGILITRIHEDAEKRRINDTSGEEFHDIRRGARD